MPILLDNISAVSLNIKCMCMRLLIKTDIKAWFTEHFSSFVPNPHKTLDFKTQH